MLDTITSTHASPTFGNWAVLLVPANHTIAATKDGNGTLTPSGSVSVADGGNQTFTFTPDAGHQIKDVLVDGSSTMSTLGGATSYTFTGVTANHTIHVVFEPISTVLPPPGGGGWDTAPPIGSVNPSDSASPSASIDPTGSVDPSASPSPTVSVKPTASASSTNSLGSLDPAEPTDDLFTDGLTDPDPNPTDAYKDAIQTDGSEEPLAPVVSADSNNPGEPATGDNGNMPLMLTLLIVSFLSIVLLLTEKKRTKPRHSFR